MKVDPEREDPNSTLEAGHGLLVSIITPTLDRKDLLRETIENVRRQTYPKIEHIVVDGGSTDSTLDLLRSYGDTITWISERDRSVYDAVNKGMLLASGEILAYLNTDDRYLPYSVEVAVRTITSEPEIGFVFGDLVTVTGNGEGLLKFYPPFNRRYLVRGGLIAQPTVFWTRRAWQASGRFDDSLGLAADMEYWMRLSTQFQGKRVEEVLAVEMEHDQRLTYGEEARIQAATEMSVLKAKYGSQHRPRLRTWSSHLWDRLRMAYWYRVSLARFMWGFIRGRDAVAGKRWGGFHSEQEHFSMSLARCAWSFIPFMGRRHKSFVAWRG